MLLIYFLFLIINAKIIHVVISTNDYCRNFISCIIMQYTKNKEKKKEIKITLTKHSDRKID